MTAGGGDPEAHRYEACRCALCGDRLGIYEPVVFETAQLRGRTSLAANPALAEIGASLFHADCYERGARTPAP